MTLRNLIQQLGQLLFHKGPGYQLNYLTLHVKDPEIAKGILQVKIQKFTRTYFFVALSCILSFAKSCWQYFISKNGHPVMVICSGAILLLLLAGFILIRLKRVDLALNIMPFIYFLIFAVGSTLVYNDWLPFQLRFGPKTVFEQQILLNFLFTNLIPPTHQIKWTLFLHLPVLILSTYFQAKQEATTLTNIYGQLPGDFQQQIEISNKSEIIINKMWKVGLIALCVILQQWVNRIELITQVIDNHTIQKQKETLNDFFSSQKDALIIYKEIQEEEKNMLTSQINVQLLNPSAQALLSMTNRQNVDLQKEKRFCCPIFKIFGVSDELLSLNELMSAVVKREDKTLTIEVTSLQMIDARNIDNQEENMPNKLTLKLTLDNLVYGDSQCKVATFHDLTQEQKLQEVRAQNKLLHIMTSCITHEFMTPLKCMKSIIKPIIKELELSQSSKKQDAEIIKTTTELLLSQVSLLLDKNMLQEDVFQANLQVQKLNLTISKTVEMLQMQAELQGIKLEFQQLNRDHKAKFDKVRVQQILINLIQNAIKFSSVGQTVTIICRSTIDYSNRKRIFTVEVKDQGIGMSPEDIKELFKPFFRTTDQASQGINKDSHGLGLSICKLLAERMNGSLSASSTIGLGSIFTFMFSNYLNDADLLKKQDLDPKGVLRKKMSQFSKQSEMVKQSETTSLPEIQESAKEDESDQSGEASIQISGSFDSKNKFIDDFSYINHIIVAEDQLINLQVVKNQLQKLGLSQKACYCANGQDAINAAKIYVEEMIINQQLLSAQEYELRPITYMLLDFQMPKKNGILVMNEVRAYFEEKNRKGFKLKPPYFLFLTAYASPSFKNYLNSLGVNEIFEKPLSETQIRKIINLNKS